MLDLKKNRLNYSQLLAPPEGFDLERAVGTSYSLDLYALLALPIALFYAKSMEGDFKAQRYDVLDAVRKSKDKIDLFYQRGKIAIPRQYNSFLAFMDDSIVPVLPDQTRASFHPKLWLLRFKKAKEIRYRIIVLSRNLTFDRSSDVAYFAEGTVGETVNEESTKLSDYLRYFYKRTKRKLPRQLLKDLEEHYVIEFTQDFY